MLSIPNKFKQQAQEHAEHADTETERILSKDEVVVVNNQDHHESPHLLEKFQASVNNDTRSQVHTDDRTRILSTRYISKEKLIKFSGVVKKIPLYISFDEAWKKYPLSDYFLDSQENLEEIKTYFQKARISLTTRAPCVSRLPNRISIDKLEEFNITVQTIPPSTSFVKAWMYHDIGHYFRDSRETLNEIKDLFDQAKLTLPLRTLQKIEDPGQFLVSCSIRGFNFNDALCDSGSCINLMSEDIAVMIGIEQLQPSKVQIRLADSSTVIPKGITYDLHVRIGNCNIPMDFHVVNIRSKEDSQLIFGGSFLVTTGAIMDWPNKRISFVHIDKDMFYKMVPYVTTNKLKSSDKKNIV